MTIVCASVVVVRTPTRSVASPGAGRRVEELGEDFGAVAVSVVDGAAVLARMFEDRGTIVAMSVEALRTVKDRLSEFVERVQREHDRVTITKNGTPAAVLISADDLESLEETLAVLSDRKAVRELAEAEAAVAAGDVVRGADALRELRGT